MKSFERITLDPAVMGGKACIRGLRVTVGTVVVSRGSPCGWSLTLRNPRSLSVS